MTRLWALLLTILMCVWSTEVLAHTTLTWDRNTETDMKEYRIYSCPGTQATPCTPTISATPEAIVVQPTTGTSVQYQPGVGKEAWYGVTAVDTANNQSGLSTTAFFDSKAPGVPKNLVPQ